MIPAFIWPGYSQANLVGLSWSHSIVRMRSFRTASIETGKEIVIASVVI